MSTTPFYILTLSNYQYCRVNQIFLSLQTISKFLPVKIAFLNIFYNSSVELSTLIYPKTSCQLHKCPCLVAGTVWSLCPSGKCFLTSPWWPSPPSGSCPAWSGCGLSWTPSWSSLSWRSCCWAQSGSFCCSEHCPRSEKISLHQPKYYHWLGIN